MRCSLRDQWTSIHSLSYPHCYGGYFSAERQLFLMLSTLYFRLVDMVLRRACTQFMWFLEGHVAVDMVLRRACTQLIWFLEGHVHS